MYIYIVRHGETELNKDGILQGWLDSSLSDKGRELALITGQGLKGIKFECAYSSPLSRAKETAEIILNASSNSTTPIVIEKRIKEINFGDYEGQVYKSKTGQIDNPNIKEFFADPFKNGGLTPNGENTFEVCERTQAFLKELALKNDDKNYLVVTHGFASRAMLNFLYEDPSSFWQTGVPSNCAVNIVEVKNHQIRLIKKDILFYKK